MALRKFQLTSTDGIDVYIPYTTADMVATTANRRFVTGSQKDYLQRLRDGRLNAIVLTTEAGKRYRVKIEEDGTLSTTEIL